jgi:hypothetical protein
MNAPRAVPDTSSAEQNPAKTGSFLIRAPLSGSVSSRRGGRRGGHTQAYPWLGPGTSKLSPFWYPWPSSACWGAVPFVGGVPLKRPSRRKTPHS